MKSFISIDQNCSTLWDVAPKLAALAARGCNGTHYLEDVDAAFSRHGAAVDDHRLNLATECYYRGGVSDWGAALFYQNFLGRLPLDVRKFGEFTGMNSTTLARKLDISVDELYAQFSDSDNQQLVGASYFSGERFRHRTIGDLTGAEIAPFMLEIIRHAARDMSEIFTDNSARARIGDWEKAEIALVESSMRGARLIDFYQSRLQALGSPETRLALTSQLFALGRNPHHLLKFFLRDYAKFAAIYNEAVAECPVGVSALETSRGEIPFFAVFNAKNRWWREQLFYHNGELRGATCGWRIENGVPKTAMRRDCVVAVAPKAVLLVLQVRLTGAALALPEQGSLYMPAAYRLQQKLTAVLPEISQIAPVWRVKFNFLTHLENQETSLRAPAYLREFFGDSPLPARDFVARLRETAATAQRQLENLRDPQNRETAWAEIFPQEYAAQRELENQRRELGLKHTDAAARDLASRLWRQIRERDIKLWREKIRWLTRRLQLLNCDYFNWRGAIYPWALATGGENFYRQIINSAEIIPENPETLK